MLEPRMPSSAAQRARHVLTARLDERWSVGRLAAALGLSRRTLYRAVRRESGLPPMSLLREARLAQARSALHAPEPQTTVTRIALECGFTHLGRFSSAYKRQFGELPSETLARAARHLRRPGVAGPPRREPAPEAGG